MERKTFTSIDLRNMVNQYGIEKVKFFLPMKPVRSIFLLPYGKSKEDEQNVICHITESKYKLKDNFKITLEPETECPNDSKWSKFKFAKESYYISDLCKMVENKTIRVFVEF